MRHAKPWCAGADRNWGLAVYGLDEIKERFDDVIRFPPDFKGRPAAKMEGVKFSDGFQGPLCGGIDASTQSEMH
jgi:hypothetical protein